MWHIKKTAVRQCLEENILGEDQFIYEESVCPVNYFCKDVRCSFFSYYKQPKYFKHGPELGGYYPISQQICPISHLFSTEHDCPNSHLFYCPILHIFFSTKFALRNTIIG